MNNLQNIKVPTLIICGKHDAILPVDQIKTLEKSIPNNKTIIYENSGHPPMVEEPERFNKDVLNFLSNH